MKRECMAFRDLLEARLVGRPDPDSLNALAWHQHLLRCADCRELFEREEALEVLLATWPEPKLSPELERRVLAALKRSRAGERSLDALLELDTTFAAPQDLARRVLAGLEKDRAIVPARAADPLDRLLDHAGRVDVPHGLERRVLKRLARERVPVRRPILAWRRSTWIAAAAAVVVVALSVWMAKHREPVPPGPVLVDDPRTRGATAPDAQMLAALDVLENWDLLMQPGDVEPLLSTLPAADEVLLELEDEG